MGTVDLCKNGRQVASVIHVYISKKASLHTAVLLVHTADNT